MFIQTAKHQSLMPLIHNCFLLEPGIFCDALQPYVGIEAPFARFEALSTDAIERFLSSRFVQNMSLYHGHWTLEDLMELRERSMQTKPNFNPFLAAILYDCIQDDAVAQGGIEEPDAEFRKHVQSAGWAQDEMMELIYGKPFEELCILSGYLQPDLVDFRMPCDGGSVGYLEELDVRLSYQRIQADVDAGRLRPDGPAEHFMAAYTTAAERETGLCMIVCAHTD